MVPSYRRRGVVLLALGAAACGGGGEVGAPPETVPTVSLSANTLTLRGVGSEDVLSATVTPANASIAWTSSRPDVATVSGSGTTARVTAVSAGSASISVQVTFGSRRADAQVSVQVVPLVRSVRLDSTDATLLLGQTRQLRARIIADAGADTTLRWISSAPAVATVSASGLITAVSVGAVRIDAASAVTATIASSVQLNVVPPQVRGVNVTPQIDTLLVGGTRRFVATVLADEGLVTGVTWTSSASTIATVATDGTVTAVSVGVAQISARSIADTSRRAQAAVVVRVPTVRAISLAAVSGLREREQRTLQATVDVDPGADARVTWRSSNVVVAQVSDDGVVNALRAGTTVISVQSVAFPPVRAERSVTVTASSPFLTWTRQPVAVVGTLREEGSPTSLLSRSATQSMVTLVNFDWPLPYDSVTLAMNGANWSRIAGTGEAVQAVEALANHGTDVIGFAGSAFNDSRRVYRWNGAAWQVLPRPNIGILDGAHGPQSLPGGTIAAKARDGAFDQILLWNGTAWSEVARRFRPDNYQQGVHWMTSPTVGFLHQNFAVGGNTFRFTNGAISQVLPPSSGFLLFPRFRGSASDSLWALSADDRRVHRWNGSAWVVYENGWPAGQPANGFDLCDGVPVVVLGDGRVYRWQGDQFRQLGVDNEVLAPEPQSFRQINCAPDGTIRVAAGSGAIARWSGTAWVLESFAPRFSSVSAVSPTLAWAGSTVGRMYRWNGVSWDESYRPAVFEPVGSIRSITSWTDGRVVALRGGNIILRRTGGVWSRETGGELTNVNAVWGPSGDLVFGVRSDGRIIRSVNGGAWQAVTPVGTALIALDGIGTSHAIAVGSSLRTVRWDGTTWTEVLPSASSTANAARLHVSATNDAWIAASFQSGGQTASRILRFDGTTWNDVDVSAIGGNDSGTGTTTLALFGSGPSNVYAVRGNARGPRTLYRFNGATWSTVTQLSAGAPDWVHLGSAVPGFALIAGSRGEVHVSRPPEP